MKKLWKQPKHKKHIAFSQRKAERRKYRTRSIRLKRHPNKKMLLRDNAKTIIAPRIFSLQESTDKTVQFLESIKTNATKQTLFIDMSGVRKIDSEAVAAFVAMMEHYGANVIGNQPTNQPSNKRLHDFGFFDQVEGVTSRGDAGRIRQYSSGREVDLESIQGLISFAMGKLGRDEKHVPSYRIFAESTENTYQHAGGDSAGSISWWASTYYDDSRQVVCFTSIDFGCGILGSIPVNSSLQKKIAMHLGIWNRLDDAGRLKRMLKGEEAPSRTGQLHRGRGLPSMREECIRGLVKNLTVVSNKAIARVADDTYETYETLDCEFSGTCVYWEVSAPQAD